jgi:hypothetical protein
LIDRTQELLCETAYRNSDIEQLARKRYSAGLRSGVRYNFDELMRDARYTFLSARDKHPCETAYRNSDIEQLARKRYSAGLRSGVRYNFDELMRDARYTFLSARDKHPNDLPEDCQPFGNPDVEPRRRLININLEQDVERVAKELHAKWQRPGLRYDLSKVVKFVRKVALDVLNTHPDDLPKALRTLGNPKMARKEEHPQYVPAEYCTQMEVRFAPHGTAFMPVRTLVIAEPGRGWSQVRVLAIPGFWSTERGESIEMLTAMTAPSVKELLASAAVMKLHVSGRHYLLAPKKRASA